MRPDATHFVTSVAHGDELLRDQASAILTVLTMAGEHLVEEVMVNRGDPTNHSMGRR
jgi:hypothetical protein